MAPQGSSTRNRLLVAMAPADRELILRFSERQTLELRQVIEMPGRTIGHVYFVEEGLVSVVAHASRGRQIEVGMIGFEGVTGTGIVLGDDQAVNQAMVQGTGVALRLPVDKLRNALESSPTLKRMMLRYVHAFLCQTSQTALINATAKLEERLARWILMSHDRLGSDDMRLTHEFLSIMLGVRRPGVTLALHHLEAKGLIKVHRSRITVVDRNGLKARANGNYGPAEAQYNRLFGDA
jgi:CRP-like cAMP-binding protein